MNFTHADVDDVVPASDCVYPIMTLIRRHISHVQGVQWWRRGLYAVVGTDPKHIRKDRKWCLVERHGEWPRTCTFHIRCVEHPTIASLFGGGFEGLSYSSYIAFIHVISTHPVGLYLACLMSIAVHGADATALVTPLLLIFHSWSSDYTDLMLH